MGNRSEVYVIKIQKKLQYGSILGFSKNFCLMLLVLPNIARLEYSYGANKQKIKKLDPCNCNVRASKNAGRHFLRSDIFTIAIVGDSFFRLFPPN